MTNLPRIIAFTGNARAGKDTAGAHLVRRYDYARYALAAPLKKACAAMFGWELDRLDDARKDELDPLYGITPRQALQALGTEYGQHTLVRLFPEFAKVTGRRLWVRSLLARAKAEPRVVITDVRFPHEAEEIKAEGGVVVCMKRPGFQPDYSHESELAVAMVKNDYTLDNSGTIADLERNLDALMSEIIHAGAAY